MPEPQETRSYIETALKQRAEGSRLAFAVIDVAANAAASPSNRRRASVNSNAPMSSSGACRSGDDAVTVPLMSIGGRGVVLEDDQVGADLGLPGVYSAQLVLLSTMCAVPLIENAQDGNPGTVPVPDTV